MPVVRNPSGTRSPYAPSKVSAAVSAAYVHVYGAQTTRYRRQIQDHATRVGQWLRLNLGGGQQTEWPREAIRDAIDHDMRTHAPSAVYESFLQAHPQPRPLDPMAWDRMEAMPDPETEANRTDPVWTILGVRPPVVPEPEPSDDRPLDEMGHRLTPLAKTKPKRVRVPPVRRSAWLAFWTALAEAEGQPMDVSLLLHRVRQGAEQRALSPAGWWQLWQAWIDRALQGDPRLVALLRAGRYRHMRAALGGVSWLAQTELSPETSPWLEGGVNGDVHERTRWPAHIRALVRAGRMRPELVARYSLDTLAAALEPARDRAIDWRGLDALEVAGALWPVEKTAFKVLGDPAPSARARELPQWAFMRLAMEAAVAEEDPTTWALRFYDALSRRAVILLDALREAGRPQPRFLEDQTARVGDQLETTFDAIYMAAVSTKWTGTVALDWRQVRARGSSISDRRTSKGVMRFWQAIDDALDAQGREGDDRPVTVALPLWHREAVELFTLRKTRTPRLQPTLLIPDLFFERLRQRKMWTLMDPGVFPELKDGTEAGYLAAEAQATSRRKLFPQAVAQVSAERLWRRLLQAMAEGSPFLVFEGSLRAAAPFPKNAPPNIGLDGVGALPVQLESESLSGSRWASAAVNLALTVDEQGQPDAEAIFQSVQTALRLLDNLTMRVEGDQPSPVRATCLGPVGYYEAIDRASAHVNHDATLVGAWVARMAEVWHTVVQRANRDLARERGRAAAWALPDAQPLGPGPFRDRLRQARKGQLPGIALSPEAEQALQSVAHEGVQDSFGGRFAVVSVWAPFDQAARLAGTTPGGIGTLYPVERVLDGDGRERVLPTPFLLHHLERHPDRLTEYARVLQHPERPRRWPVELARLSHPDREAWEERLQHAALIRPWVEQGISLTLPLGLPEALLHQLVLRAWWLGLNAIRFAAPMRAAGEGAALVLPDAADGMDKEPEGD